MDTELLCGHGWARISRNNQTIHYGVSGHVAYATRASLSSSPLNGAGLPARMANVKVSENMIASSLRTSKNALEASPSTLSSSNTYRSNASVIVASQHTASGVPENYTPPAHDVTNPNCLCVSCMLATMDEE